MGVQVGNSFVRSIHRVFVSILYRVLQYSLGSNTQVDSKLLSKYSSKIQIFDSRSSRIFGHYFSNSEAGSSYSPKFVVNLLPDHPWVNDVIYECLSKPCSIARSTKKYFYATLPRGKVH